ncbi:MAG: TetR/AcrR family transcriptional regulator [Thermoleophilia bacterium]
MDPRPYHHGDLRRALLEAAEDAVARSGPAALSLRELARSAGVSHAAPAHHFGSKTGLLTAIGASGFAALADALAAARATGDFAEVGAAYVAFAAERPGAFAVMFDVTLLDWSDPALQEAGGRARGELTRAVAAAAGGAPDPEAAELAAWSLVHGLAALSRGGMAPGGEDPAALARRVGAAVRLVTGATGDDRPAD